MSTVEGTFVVGRELGLHARPAGEFVRIAGRYSCDVEISRGGGWLNGKSVLSILSMGATRGTRLTVRARGDGAAEALAQLGALIEEPADPE